MIFNIYKIDWITLVLESGVAPFCNKIDWITLVLESGVAHLSFRVWCCSP